VYNLEGKRGEPEKKMNAKMILISENLSLPLKYYDMKNIKVVC